MSGKTARLGLQLHISRPVQSSTTSSVASTPRHISSAILARHSCPSRYTPLAANLPQTSVPSSFFTPSLCRTRNVSTASAPQKPSEVLDWNTFFNLRTSRRRYALASSILTSVGSTSAAIIALSEIPDLGNTIQTIIPTDPFISMGIATFGATFFGWLIGPVFGNTIWRLLHRSRIMEFTIKEKAFFERIKKHRVNPSGASTNNPVPDFYGEKVGSVAGYRRWLKDQRAFNRKRGGNYPATV